MNDKLSKDSYKYLKMIYKQYLKNIKSSPQQPNYFDNGNFNKYTDKLTEFSIRNSMSALFDLKFTKKYTDGGFLLLNDGIVYYETHCISYKLKQWLLNHLIAIIALLVATGSFVISLISLTLNLNN